LAYKVTARYVYGDGSDPVTSVKTVRQDEIDKCRQEYVDFDTPRFGPLSAVPGREAFQIGVSPDPDNPKMVSYKDCFAHILPSRAQEAKELKAEFPGVDITSGYRSPRRNWDLYKHKKEIPQAAWSSWHIFGRAIDLDYLPHSAENWEDLWGATVSPKILEANGAIPMLYVKTNDSEEKRGRGYPADIYERSALFGLGYCLHLGE
jgi:hypothetical protein